MKSKTNFFIFMFFNEIKYVKVKLLTNRDIKILKSIKYLFFSRKMRKLINKSLLNSIRFRQSYLLKNARIVNADFSEQGDVLIENGKIA